jgi:hypothetical protein
VDTGPGAGDGTDGRLFVYAVIELELLGPVLGDGAIRERSCPREDRGRGSGVRSVGECVWGRGLWRMMASRSRGRDVQGGDGVYIGEEMGKACTWVVGEAELGKEVESGEGSG